MTARFSRAAQQSIEFARKVRGHRPRLQLTEYRLNRTSSTSGVLTFFTNPFFFDMKPWLGIAVTAVVISTLCWLPLVRNLTGSIAEMMRATARIAEGRFNVALETKRRDELGLLGASINQMAGRLETFTEGRKRFLGAAAHELRSPLARIQLVAEILQRNVNPAAQKYVDDLTDDVLVMSRLTVRALANILRNAVRCWGSRPHRCFCPRKESERSDQRVGLRPGSSRRGARQNLHSVLPA